MLLEVLFKTVHELADRPNNLPAVIMNNNGKTHKQKKY